LVAKNAVIKNPLPEKTPFLKIEEGGFLKAGKPNA
jgi:hypothetical protein